MGETEDTKWKVILWLEIRKILRYLYHSTQFTDLMQSSNTKDFSKDLNDPRICMEPQDPKYPKQSWKEAELEGSHSGQQVLPQNYAYQDSWLLAQKGSRRSTEQRKKTQKHTIIWSFNLGHQRKEYVIGKNLFNQWHWKTELQAKEWNRVLSYTIRKSNLKMDSRPKCETWNHKNPMRAHRKSFLWHWP